MLQLCTQYWAEILFCVNDAAPSRFFVLTREAAFVLHHVSGISFALYS
jgi:hypothetical protein